MATDAQRDALVALGCDELPGYLFAKPMSAKAPALWAGGDAPVAGSAFIPSLFEASGTGTAGAVTNTPPLPAHKPRLFPP